MTASLPRRIDPLAGPWPLHDAAASRAAETLAQAAAAPHALMARAGLGVARLALARFPGRRRVLVLCGPGNNGGDGLVAALQLRRCGLDVRVEQMGDADRLPSDALWARAEAVAAGVAISAFAPGGGAAAGGRDVAPDLVIDALLGLGARRPPAGALAEAIDRCASLGAPVLAIDLPSGLNPDTGQPLGTAVVRADVTLSLLTLKPGLFTGRGRDLAGEVWFDDLGVPADAASPTAWLAGPAALPARPHATHKGAQGDVIVVGGAPGMVGAAWLAADAALQSGAGRVYLSLLDRAAPGFDPGRPELMSRPQAWLAAPAALAAATVVCGCGGGDAIGAALPPLLAHAARLVLDADALNAIARDLPLQSLLRNRAARGLPTVLTPHPLEAARLLGREAAAVQADRLTAACDLVAATGAVVVLKGSGSVIAASDAPTRINPTGNGALATAGTGDVLAGWIGGCWAQQPRAAAIDVAAGAAWRHGRAADEFVATGGGGPLRAAALVSAMAGVQA